MNHQQLYKLLMTVQKNVRCPQCGKQYAFEAIQIKSVLDTIVILELRCTSHMPLLATVTFNGKAARTTESIDTVNQNDVIEIYKFLKGFNGSFEELFNNKKK